MYNGVDSELHGPSLLYSSPPSHWVSEKTFSRVPGTCAAQRQHDVATTCQPRVAGRRWESCARSALADGTCARSALHILGVCASRLCGDVFHLTLDRSTGQEGTP